MFTTALRPGTTLSPGFTNAVSQSQQTFRAALQALAQPGSIQEIPVDCGAPAGLTCGMAAMLLALADGDTPVWLPAARDRAVDDFLRFHCACPLVVEPLQAGFVVVPAGHTVPRLDHCAPGHPAYPDTSGTLLIEVESLGRDGAADPVVLTGPGIADKQRLSVSGLPTDFWAQWRENHRLFPLGVDAFLIDGSRICGLPRTVKVES